MIRISLYASLTLALCSTAALAEGGQAAPPPPPLLVVPERCTAAFDCAYVGIEFGQVSGDWEALSPTVPLALPMGDGDALGIFAGYNWQNGSLVYGGEVRYLRFNDYATAPGLGFSVDNVIDLRGRLGFAGERTLFYGALGYSLGEATAPGGNVDIDGFNVGLGAEYNVTDSLFVGIDYTGRQLEGTLGAFTYDGDVNTLTLRLGLRF